MGNMKNVIVKKEEDLDIIEIKESICVLDYVNDLEKAKINHSIPTRLYLMSGESLLKSVLLPQSLYLFEEENWTYTITIGDKGCILSGIKREDKLYETEIKWDEESQELRIICFTHSLAFSTGEIKIYSNRKAKEDFDFFSLDVTKAKEKALELLDQLYHSRYVGLYINELLKIYKKLDLANPSIDSVIEDELIFLANSISSCNGKSSTFEIYKKVSREKVGEISFSFMKKPFYGGNIYYEIKEEHQGKHYATRALELIKAYLKSFAHREEDDLYVAIEPTNIASLRVVGHHKGELVYEGEVPKEDSLYQLDHIKEVKIYKIHI